MQGEPSKPGIRQCLCCRWLFVSADVERIRRCPDCTETDDYAPRSAKLGGSGEASSPEEAT